MSQNEKNKLELISKIFSLYLSENPNRQNDWYGKLFDRLYDMQIDTLQQLLFIKTPINFYENKKVIA